MEGEATTFGVSGKLWKDALIMYDRSSRSLWSQVTGKCVKGEYSESELTVYPSVQTTWGEWKKAHPGTEVLFKESGTEESSRYASYFDNPDKMGIFGSKSSDSRLAGKEIVLGLRLDGETAAYPLTLLDENPVINDKLAGRPIVITWVKESRSAFVFIARHNQIELTFDAAPEKGELYLKDNRTGTVWDARKGVALGGPIVGKQLSPLPATQVFWFAWSSFFPRTRLWSGEIDE